MNWNLNLYQRLGQKKIPLIESKEQVQDHLVRLNEYKSLRSDDMQTNVLKELTDYIHVTLHNSKKFAAVR